MNINLEALFDGADPFAHEEVEKTGYGMKEDISEEEMDEIPS